MVAITDDEVEEDDEQQEHGSEYQPDEPSRKHTNNGSTKPADRVPPKPYDPNPFGEYSSFDSDNVGQYFTSDALSRRSWAGK